MKKILILTIVVSCLGLLTGCGKEKTKNKISYTNKYECSRSINITKNKYDASKRNSGITLNPGEEDTSPQAVEYIRTQIHDFNEDGTKVLAVYNIFEYKYLLDYNMEEEKEYFNKQCDNIDKKNYKSCNVSLENKTITVTNEVNINSETTKEYYSELTLDDLKEDYVADGDGTYTCK